MSLKSIHQKVEAVNVVNEEEIDLSTLPKDTFTEQRFLNLWNSYAEDLYKKGEKSLASILKANKPVLNNLTIQYTLPTQLMSEQLHRLKPKLLKHLRETLNNFSIDITIDVAETEVKKFVYTPQEKFEKLKESYPELDLLKSLFKLDF